MNSTKLRHRTGTTRSPLRAAALACALLAGAAPAQQAEPQPRQPDARPTPPADPLPGLDELLGIEGERRAGEESRELPPAEDPSRRELERRLSGEEVGEAFVQAVTLMGETADRLETARDAGVVTQRLQEDILRKLDQIIAATQDGQSGSSSSAQQQPEQQNQPNQQQQQQNQQGEQSDSAQDAPQLQRGELAPQGPADAAAWGALRERVRDALTQGTSDPFSSMYRSLTEAYYRRLAEGDSP